jgi:hypothetical protein
MTESFGSTNKIINMDSGGERVAGEQPGAYVFRGIGMAEHLALIRVRSGRRAPGV